MPDLPLNECPLIQLKELERGLHHNPRRVEHQFPDVMVGSEDLRPPGGGNSSLLGGRPVQNAQLNAHGLHQAAGAGPLSWSPGWPIKQRLTLSTPGVTPDRFGALKRPVVRRG